MKQRVGAKGQIAWRRNSCRVKVDDRYLVNSPICIEAVIRFRNGIFLTVGVGFDRRSDRPKLHTDAMWGLLAVRGKGCEFLRHPDHIDGALTGIDALMKAGRCQ